MQTLESIRLQEYNDEPVYYCPHCLSLKIKRLNEFIDYCDDCGCTEIETTSIDNWQEIYKKRFNKYYSDYGRDE